MSSTGMGIAGSALSVSSAEPELIRMCRTRQWNSAITQVSQKPIEAFMSCYPHGTAIAAACRYSGPTILIQALMDSMSNLRKQLFVDGDLDHGLSDEQVTLAHANPLRFNRGGHGTPLHEAVDNEEMDLDVIKILIDADRGNLGLRPRPSSENFRFHNDREAIGSREIGFGSRNDSDSSRSNQVRPPANPTNAEEAPEAICTQDVDGQIPLHLMIRRVFRSCPRPLKAMMASSQDNEQEVSNAEAEAAEQYDAHLLRVLADVIDAYPEGCNLADLREYQETPLVLALKANLYAQYRVAPYSIRTDALTEESTRLWDEMLEARIFSVIKIMLDKYPLAANHLSALASSSYTVLHSALFHGRMCRTLQIIMDAARPLDLAQDLNLQLALTSSARSRHLQEDSRSRRVVRKVLTLPKLLVQPNSPNSELPLHVACMRLEKLATLQLLCRECPEAVSKRDQHGRTPLMWLWIRHCAVPIGDGGAASLPRAGQRGAAVKRSTVCSCAAAERPVTFFDMRYVPSDFVTEQDRRVDALVKHLHPRLKRLPAPEDGEITGLESWLDALARSPLYNFDIPGLRVEPEFHEEDELSPQRRRMYHKTIFSTREAASAVLFWEKVLTIMRAFLKTEELPSTSRASILHVAATHPSVPSFVIDVILKLYPQFVSKLDSLGRSPLHLAAARPSYKWKPFPHIASGAINMPLEEVYVEAPLLKILNAYPDACKLLDHQRRLPIHCAIDCTIKMLYRRFEDHAAHDYELPSGESGFDDEIYLYETSIEPLVHQWPASLEFADGTTSLLPFMQAASIPKGFLASEREEQRNSGLFDKRDRQHLNVVFSLLRLNPEMIRCGIPCSTKESETNLLKRRISEQASLPTKSKKMS